MDRFFNDKGEFVLNSQSDYDTYVSLLPDGRRNSGLQYDETHRGIPLKEKLKGKAKSEATVEAKSEFSGDNNSGYNYHKYSTLANERWEDNESYYSLQEIIDANQAFASGRRPDVPYDPHNVLAYANLHLTSTQITELKKNGLSDKRVLSPRMVAFGTALKEKIDAKGWTIKNVHVDKDKESLRYTIASGNNQIDVVGFSPKEKHLGNFYINGNSVFRNPVMLGYMQTGVDKYGRSRNKIPDSGADAANLLMPQIEYFLEGPNPSKFNSFDVYPATNLNNATTVGMHVSDERPRSRNGSRIRYDRSFSIGHNTPSNTKFSDLSIMSDTRALQEPRTMDELIRNAYEKASLSSDENEVADLIDLDTILLDDGTIDVDQIDMEIVIRHSDMTSVMRIFNEDAQRRIRNGDSIQDVRDRLLYGRGGIKGSDGIDVQLSEDAQNDGYDEDSMDISEDNGAFVRQGARERIANFMVGMTDDSGEPFVGWMDLDSSSNKEDYENVLFQTKRAAEESGISDFEGRFDNDGVLHWTGQQGVEFDENNQPISTKKISHKIGQFFFPAVEDEYDNEGNLLRKAGVLDLKRGNGKEDLRVDNYSMSFTPPTKNKKKLLERTKVTGLSHKMFSAIHASIKSQVLTRTSDEGLSLDTALMYDSTRINKAYEDMARIDRDRMLHQGVVEHLKSSFLIDKSYLDRDAELRESFDFANDDDQMTAPQSVRLPLRGLEGVYDALASSDGETLGLRGYYTEEFMRFLDQERERDPNGFVFDKTGQLGILHYTGKVIKETPMERWLTGNYEGNGFDQVTEEIPWLPKLDIEDDLKELNDMIGKDSSPELLKRRSELVAEVAEKTRDHRFMYASPMVRLLRQNYAQYDSPDRVLMTAKMAEVAKDIIGGPLDSQNRDRVRVSLMSVGGLTFEDSIVISRDFAEAHGLKMGDKLADNHSNKGVIGYIAGLDPSDPAYNADAEQAFIDAEESGYPLDMIQSPYGMTSRANMGLGMELINSREDRKGPIYYNDGPNKGEIRGYAGEISIIVTNMEAEKKTNMYEIQDLGRRRTFSYQQALALQSHGASATIGHILGNSELKHADLLMYQNIIGYTTTSDNEIVQRHYGMQEDTVTREVDGKELRFEELDPSFDTLVISTQSVKNYGFPSEPSYLQLPVYRNAYLHGDINNPDNPVQTMYVPMLPDRLRRETKTYDGEYVEHDYTMQMTKIAEASAQVEHIQMHYLTTYPEELEDFKKLLGDDSLTDDKVRELFENGDPDFMRVKASYPFEEKIRQRYFEAVNSPPQESQSFDELSESGESSRKSMKSTFEEDLEQYQRSSRVLHDAVDRYERAVEKDQFGVDHRSKKRSFARRKVLSKELPNSATAILTNDTSLPLDEVGISPALGINLGVLEPKDVEAWEKALATEDPAVIHEEARRNWKYKEGMEDAHIMSWRDPVLHDGSVFASKFRVDERLAGVSINPIMTATLGADFDGDTFGLTFISDKAVQKEWADKLNIRYNMMDARGNLAILNDGMDNVDYMGRWIEDESENGFIQEIPWAKEQLEKDANYFKDSSPADVLSDYISHIEDETWKHTDIHFEYLAQKRGFDIKKYDELIKQAPFKLHDVPEDVRSIIDEGSELYDEAYRDIVDEYTFDTVQNMTDIIVKNERQYASRHVDITNKDTILASQISMAKDGAKGKVKDIESRNKSYILNGVTKQDIIDVRTAQETKVGEIGRSGSQTLDATPVLSDHTFFNGRRAVNGATVGMDVTETASQSILQIKHSPKDVPAALRFLNQSPKLFKGHYEGFKDADETKPIWIQLSPDILGKDENEMIESYNAMVNGEPGPVEKAANGTDVVLARTVDRMLLKSYEKSLENNSRPASVYIDINHGVLTNKNPNYNNSNLDEVRKYYKDETRIDWRYSTLPEDNEHYVPIDGESSYRLMMKTIYQDAGLRVSDYEVDAYTKMFREDDNSPRENAGMVRNHSRNTFENSDVTDIMARHGAQALHDIVDWNNRNKQYPKRVTDTGYSKPYSVDYSDVHNIVNNEYKQAHKLYDEQKERITELRKSKQKLDVDNKPAEIVVDGKSYPKTGNDALVEAVRNAKSENESTNIIQPATVKEAPQTVAAPAKPDFSDNRINDSDREQLKNVMMSNETYSNNAISNGRDGNPFEKVSGEKYQQNGDPFL